MMALTVFVITNNSLGLFSRLILRGAKLAPPPLETNSEVRVENIKLKLPPPQKPTGGVKVGNKLSHARSHSIESQLCVTPQPTVSF